MATGNRPRRRRPRNEAEREILDAAAALLAEAPFEDLTVSGVMARTTLSRKSFYVYFADRYDLLTRMVQPLRARGDAVMGRWSVGAPGDRGRPTIRGIAELYAEHGLVLRALADAARRHPEARRVWREFTEPVIALIAARLREDPAVAPVDVDATVRVLVGMNLAAFFDQLVGQDPSPEQIDALVDTLNTVWRRTFWP
jgi:TetR/AcrR family transcriptional regulator, ethionamide resistance regulator